MKTTTSRDDRGVMTSPPAVVFPPDPRESGTAVVNRIFRAHGLYADDKGNDESLFDRECLDFVKDIVAKDPCHDESLRDYTTYPFITIDNDDSTDLDQAMWISQQEQESTSKGGVDTPSSSSLLWMYRVSYALADGAYFCPAFSPLFQRALRPTRSGILLFAQQNDPHAPTHLVRRFHESQSTRSSTSTGF